MKKIVLAFVLIFAASDYAMDLHLRPRDVALCAAYTLGAAGIAIASGESDVCTLALDAVNGMAFGAAHAMVANGLRRIAQDPLASTTRRTAAGVLFVSSYMPTLVGIAGAMGSYLSFEKP